MVITRAEFKRFNGDVEIKIKWDGCELRGASRIGMVQGRV